MVINYLLNDNQLIFLAYYAKCPLLVPPDFLNQKCEIEESITNSVNGAYHFMIYYPKYHCKLNYIRHFWYKTKKLTRDYLANASY